MIKIRRESHERDKKKEGSGYGTGNRKDVMLNSRRRESTMNRIPNPNDIFPNQYKTSCFIKNVITAPNIFVGDYTYYDDPVDPTAFERNNVLFNCGIWR